MTAQERLQAASERFRHGEACCAVPLVLPNADCDRHPYRGLIVDLARLDLPESLCARVLVMETQAMARALTYFRDTILKDAAAALLGAPQDGYVVYGRMLEDLNHLIGQLER